MTAPVKSSRRREVDFIKWVALASFLLSLIQLILGVDPLILMLCLITEAVCLLPVMIYGFNRTVAIFFLFIWFSFSFTTLLFKTAMLQPIDSNLFNPLLTFSIQLAGALAFLLAATVASFFKITQKNSIRIVENPDTLSAVGKIFFIIGTLGFFLSHPGSQYAESFATSGASMTATVGRLINVLIGYGIVCETVSTIVRSNKTKSFSITSILMMAILAGLGLLGNSKSGILLPALIYVSCVAAYRVRVHWKTVLSGVLVIAFLSQFLFPAVHITRQSRARSNLFEVGGATIGAVVGLMTGDSQTLAEKDALETEARSSADLYKNLYFGSQQIWLDRFVNTGFIDAVARRLSFDGPFLGLDPVVGNTFYGVLPRQLNPHKYDTFQIEAGDAVLEAYGLQTAYTGGAATVPLPIELFAADGFWAIFLIGTPLIFLVIMEINFFVFDFRENPWAVCFVIFYGMPFYAQSHQGFAFMALRQMPFDFFSITLGVMLATMIKNGFRAAGASRAVSSVPVQ